MITVYYRKTSEKVKSSHKEARYHDFLNFEKNNQSEHLSFQNCPYVGEEFRHESKFRILQTINNKQYQSGYQSK